MSDVVVTGLGVLAPNGSGTERFWSQTLAGVSGISEITDYDPARYPARSAGRIIDFDARAHLPGRLLPQSDRVTRMALVAADWALSDSGVDLAAVDPFDIGVMTTNATGGFAFTHAEMRKLWTRGPAFVSAYQSFAWFYAANTGQISIRNKARGPSTTLVAEQAGGLDVIGHACRTVGKGTPLVVTGGVESSLDPWGWVCHLASGGVSEVPDPRRAYLPFDTDATGYLPGEGGAILVVEDDTVARARRSAHRYGRIGGWASTFDTPTEILDSSGLRRAAELAMAQADISAQQVDVVFADGAGTPRLDAAEAMTLRKLFGPRKVPVTVPKTMTGRLMAGGGPLDVVCALLSMRDDVIPPTTNVDRPVTDYELDIVLGRPRRQRVETALVLARGHGGFNSAMVLHAV